jgi:hypothetical protein
MLIRSLCVLFAVLSVAIAQDASDKQIGVWKLNIGRSQLPPSTNPIVSASQTVEKVGPKTYRETFNIVFKEGPSRKAETVRRYDGSEKKLEGQVPGTETCEIVDANTLKCTTKRDGKVTAEVTATFLPDGKTMTARSKVVGRDGQPTMSVRVYEKQ